MHPAVFNVFDEICRVRQVSGSVLEIGATPDESTLLNLPSLNAATEKIGINKAGASRFRDFVIQQADANDLAIFQTGVLMPCCATRCWSTIPFSGKPWRKSAG